MSSTAGVRPGLVIDPRIRRRRVEVTRSRGRRRLMIASASLTLVALSALAFVIVRSPLFEASRLDVAGATHTSRGVIARVTGLASHPTMASVDAARIARRVEALPWVKRAWVTKEWPSTIRIVVEERTAVGQVAVPGGQWSLVDVTGRLLASSRSQWPGVPALGVSSQGARPGSSVGGAAAAGALEVAAELPEPLRGEVTSVSETSGGLEMTLGPSGPAVVLGPATELSQKFEAVETVLARVSVKGVAAIDVTVPQDPALTPR